MLGRVGGSLGMFAELEGCVSRCDGTDYGWPTTDVGGMCDPETNGRRR